MTQRPTAIFDCDGVLVDSERLVQQIDMAMIADLGWPITREEILTQHLGRTEVEVAANIERHIGRELPPTFRRERDAAYTAAFRERLVEVPGVRASVEGLLASGWQVCVASSGSHARMELTLGVTKLRDLFRGRIFSAQDVERGKPAPDLFLHAAREMQADVTQCVVIEDSPSGVSAARAADMPVVGYAALTPASDLIEATTIIESMDRLITALESCISAT